MTRSLPTLLLGLTALLAACSQAPSAPTASAPGQQAPGTSSTLTPYGTLELGTSDLQSQFVTANPVGGFTFTKLGATARSEDSLYVYLSTTYRVKNTGKDALPNVTLLAVSTPQTYPDTPIKSLKLPSGADAGGQVTKFRPTHGISVVNGEPRVNAQQASLQLFDLSDVTHLNGRNGVTQAYPWGYVVDVMDPSQQVIPGDTRTLGPGKEGTVTVAAKIRKASVDPAANTAASFSVMYVIVGESESRFTVSPDEIDGNRAYQRARLYSGTVVTTGYRDLNCNCTSGGVDNPPVIGPLHAPRTRINPIKVLAFTAQSNYTHTTTENLNVYTPADWSPGFTPSQQSGAQTVTSNTTVGLQLSCTLIWYGPTNGNIEVQSGPQNCVQATTFDTSKQVTGSAQATLTVVDQGSSQSQTKQISDSLSGTLSLTEGLMLVPYGASTDNSGAFSITLLPEDYRQEYRLNLAGTRVAEHYGRTGYRSCSWFSCSWNYSPWSYSPVSSSITRNENVQRRWIGSTPYFEPATFRTVTLIEGGPDPVTRTTTGQAGTSTTISQGTSTTTLTLVDEY